MLGVLSLWMWWDQESNGKTVTTATAATASLLEFPGDFWSRRWGLEKTENKTPTARKKPEVRKISWETANIPLPTTPLMFSSSHCRCPLTYIVNLKEIKLLSWLWYLCSNEQGLKHRSMGQIMPLWGTIIKVISWKATRYKRCLPLIAVTGI